MLATLLTLLLVVLVAAALLWFVGRLPMFDAGLLQIARAVVYLCVGLYVLFAVVGLFTGRTYVPVIPLR